MHPEGPAEPRRAEIEVASDLVRRGLLVAPVILLTAGLWRGVDGLVSAAVAIAVVLVNFGIAAVTLSWASRISPNALLGAVFLGYALRLGIVLGAFLVVREQSWADIWVFGITLIVTHVGLLVWETRYVGLTLAAPGLKPRGLAEGEE
jgi:hypothetical protein